VRGLVGGLILAIVILAVALAVALAGALGVAAIGWLLQHWFDLTQWQGTVIALSVAAGLGLLIYKMSTPASIAPDWDDWGDLWDEEEDEDEDEPPIVPWRRSRPTPGDLPSDTQRGSKKRHK